MDIQEDVLRFCKSHNWYRSLPWKGKDYLIFPWVGQQPRSTLDVTVEDPVGLHWWLWDADFIEEIPINGIGKDIIMRRPIKFNCFLRGFDGPPENRYFAGVSVIKMRYPNVEEELRQKYKSHKKKDISYFANMNHIEQVDNAVSTAFHIHELFKAKCPEWLTVKPFFRPTRITIPFIDLSNCQYYRHPSPHPIKKSASEKITPRKASPPPIKRAKSEIITPRIDKISTQNVLDIDFNCLKDEKQKSDSTTPQKSITLRKSKE